jgi:microcystin-dependent protein
MAEPFLGEIRTVSFNFPPKGWALCDGQVLPINQNQALFALLGTTFGGNGQTNFALPDLRGRHPLGESDTHPLGERAGSEQHTVTLSQLPQHSHRMKVATRATGTTPGNSLLASPGKPAFAAGSNTAMNPTALLEVGGSQPHENRSPYLALNFVMALQGIFPSPN